MERGGGEREMGRWGKERRLERGMEREGLVLFTGH